MFGRLLLSTPAQRVYLADPADALGRDEAVGEAKRLPGS